MKFSCGEILTNVVGVGNSKEGTSYAKGGNDGIISPITPVNEMVGTEYPVHSFTQVYTAEGGAENEKGELSGAENLPSSFEHGVDALEGYVESEELGHYQWSKAGEELTNVSTAVEPVEIKG